MKTIDFSYFIERYNAGEMSEAEKQWFRKELNGNEKLRDEVNLRKRTDEVLKDQDIISLRNKLSKIEKRRETNVQVGKSKKPASLKYAAVIAGVVLIGSIALFSRKNLSSDEIMSRYYKAYEPLTSQRSVQSEADEDFTQAIEFYDTHDYKNAAVYFSKVVKKEPKDMYSTLLNGIANFENNKYPEAKLSLGKVIDNNSNYYIDQAQWFLAMCYIKTDEKEKAIQLLENIKKEGGVYRNAAKKIIRNLK